MKTITEFLIKKHTSSNYNKSISQLEDIKDGDYFAYDFVNYEGDKIIVYGECIKRNNNLIETLFCVRMSFDNKNNPLYMKDYNAFPIYYYPDTLEFDQEPKQRKQTFRSVTDEEYKNIEKIQSYISKHNDLHKQRTIGYINITGQITWKK